MWVERSSGDMVRNGDRIRAADVPIAMDGTEHKLEQRGESTLDDQISEEKRNLIIQN